MTNYQNKILSYKKDNASVCCLTKENQTTQHNCHSQTKKALPNNIEVIKSPQKTENKTIFRAPKETPYCERIQQNFELSDRASRILTYLLSLPENWTVYHWQLSRLMKKDPSYITKGMTELVKKGYAERVRLRRGDGKWDRYQYVIKEIKTTPEDSFNQSYKTSSGKPVVEMQETRERDNKKDIIKEPTYHSLPSLNEPIGLVGLSSKENLAAKEIKPEMSLKFIPNPDLSDEERWESVPTDIAPKPVILPLEAPKVKQATKEPAKQEKKPVEPVIEIHPIIAALEIPLDQKKRLAAKCKDLVLLQEVLDYHNIPEVKEKVKKLTGSIWNYYDHPEQMRTNAKKYLDKRKDSMTSINKELWMKFKELRIDLIRKNLRSHLSLKEDENKAIILDIRDIPHKIHFNATPSTFIEQIEKILRDTGELFKPINDFLCNIRQQIYPKQSYA